MQRRISTGAYIIIFIFVIFLLRLWHLQVIKGKEYKKIAEHNRLRIIKIPAPRGIIYDRNNTPLVKNIPTFDISLSRAELPQDPQTFSELGNLIGLDPQEIKEKLNGSSINPFEPVKLKENVSWKDVAKVEARRIDFPGLQVDVETSREYLYGSVGSHVIGYLGRLTPQQAKNPDYKDVPRRAFIGQWGAERLYDKVLRGVVGEKVIEVDAVGRKIRFLGERDAIKGNDIKLAIDIELQRNAEESLKNKTGAVVAVEPDTGDILVLASTPSFDPNLFARGIDYKDWERFINDPRKPLINRALQSQYPPGSTFKIITAIAGLEEGVITDATETICRGRILLGNRIFRCWREEGHGVTAFKKAIVESCDVFFYEAGRKLGIDKIAEYALMFGLGEPTGINLSDEKSGVVPSTQWKYKNMHQQWFLGETFNTAIGQGYVSATPIQMARFIASVVNGGKIYKLNLLRTPETKPRVIKEVKLRPETFEKIKNALAGVVAETGGTGNMARSNLISIGGKTGTAQVVGKNKHSAKYKDHAWFVAFAPGENPGIAMAVFVEHGGHGGTTAAPIAKAVIEEFFKDRNK